MKNHERRAVFLVFHSSLTSETLFLAISDEKTQATSCFLRFPHFVHERRMIFGVFSLSPAEEGHSSRCYFVFPHEGNLIFAGFWFSLVREIRFLLLYVTCNILRVTLSLSVSGYVPKPHAILVFRKFIFFWLPHIPDYLVFQIFFIIFVIGCEWRCVAVCRCNCRAVVGVKAMRFV